MIIVLTGPTYLTRLWCLWELFVIHSIRSLREVIFWSVAPFTTSKLLDAAKTFSVQDADCYIAKDKATINAMIEKFGSGGARACL